MMTEGRLSEINVAVFMQAGRNNKNKYIDLPSFYVCNDNNADRHYGFYKCNKSEHMILAFRGR